MKATPQVATVSQSSVSEARELSPRIIYKDGQRVVLKAGKGASPEKVFAGIVGKAESSNRLGAALHFYLIGCRCTASASSSSTQNTAEVVITLKGADGSPRLMEAMSIVLGICKHAFIASLDDG